MNKSIIGMIPARYASTRLPGKPLVDIAGKSMIQRVYEQCKKSTLLNDVFVVTDHQEIFNHVSDFGKVILTDPSIPTGTLRCIEGYLSLNRTDDFLINIQGDEPFIQPQQIDELANGMVASNAEIATLIKSEILDHENPNRVKVVVNSLGEANYFSRKNIPSGNSNHEFWLHIGMYGFHTSVLNELKSFKESTWEKAEKLEQLTWLYEGKRIKAFPTKFDSISVDTAEDLQKAIHYAMKNQI